MNRYFASPYLPMNLQTLVLLAVVQVAVSPRKHFTPYLSRSMSQTRRYAGRKLSLQEERQCASSIQTNAIGGRSLGSAPGTRVQFKNCGRAGVLESRKETYLNSNEMHGN